MVHETIRHNFQLNQSTATPICNAIQHAIETGKNVPSYLGVHLMDASDVPAWFQNRAAAARDRDDELSVHLTLDPHNESTPDGLAALAETLDAAYEEWHTQTTILENFSSDELTYRGTVTLDADGHPITVEISACFEMWGLPESSVPTFEEAVTTTVSQALPSNTSQSKTPQRPQGEA
ncbi:hypothetical protein [Salinibaculum rarum]|uniref:hypothetical protein n=1 Tax=Salinibaculum rarum TaxID=3058903 RepID=UPI00265DBEAF|nr:hypothetical protein [Salinibaculum sp. KK48]